MRSISGHSTSAHSPTTSNNVSTSTPTSPHTHTCRRSELRQAAGRRESHTFTIPIPQELPNHPEGYWGSLHVYIHSEWSCTGIDEEKSRLKDLHDPRRPRTCSGGCCTGQGEIPEEPGHPCGLPPFCKLCVKEDKWMAFSNAEEARQHQLRQHFQHNTPFTTNDGGIQIYKCPFTSGNKTLSQKTSISGHYSAHMFIRVRCKVGCGSWFASEISLQRHMDRTHGCSYTEGALWEFVADKRHRDEEETQVDYPASKKTRPSL